MTCINQCLLNVSNDTIFTTLTAIFVLVLGGITKWIYEQLRSCSNRMDMRKYFIAYLKSLIPSIEKRISNFESLANFAKEPRGDFVFTATSIRSDHVGQLPHTLLFSSVVRGWGDTKNKRLNTYNNLLDALTFFTNQAVLTENQFKYCFDHHTEYQRSWQNSVNRVIILHREYLVYNNSHHIRPSEDQFLTEINKTHHEWSELPDNQTRSIVDQKLLQPIKEICIRYQADPRRALFLKEIIDAQAAYGQIDLLFKAMNQYFEEQTQHTMAKKKLIEITIPIIE
jgi:hypothetical protein